MKKKIKQLALVAATIFIILFGLVFTLSQYHQTSLSNELAAQIMRLFGPYKHSEEINYAKFILKTISENETPPDNWLSLVGPRSDRFGDASFYFFKVWFVESGTTTKDIENSYPVYAHTHDSKILIELRYGRANPTIQFQITTDSENEMTADATFPLNNCLFQPDYNQDEAIDLKDVKLAERELLNKIK